MKIAFTHNIKLRDSLEEAEFDTPETVAAVENALMANGYQVELVDVNCPASHLVNRLEASRADMVFNTAEGLKGRYREAFYPGLFEQLALPFTGSDAYTLTLTLDKELSKKVAQDAGVEVPRGYLLTPDHFERGVLESKRCRFPLIVKPNFEGSSKGIDQNSVVQDRKALQKIVEQRMGEFPSGLLIEEYIEGRDITVPCIQGVHSGGPALTPLEYVVSSSYKRQYNIYDYNLKNNFSDFVDVRCPAEMASDQLARIQSVASELFYSFGSRDFARMDFRLGKDGRLYFIEINALPSLEPGAGIYAAAEKYNLGFNQVIEAIVHSACLRYGLRSGLPNTKKKSLRSSQNCVVGLAFNLKRSQGEHEAEFDPPKTIDAIEAAIKSEGHEVVRLEANSDFPKRLAELRPDIVFNIAEGYRGRNRESVVPALCELLGITYTGSDATTLAVALDKSLAKKVMRQHDILTPKSQTFTSHKDKLKAELIYPVILKPNAEGSSKGIEAQASLASDESDLRKKLANLIQKFGPSILVEEYIGGREFTVGFLGDKRPRMLPPMEIVFLDSDNKTPVYDYAIKQNFEKHVRYECPAKLSSEELKKIEKVCRDVFTSLGCRDVARIDLKMCPKGETYVIEVNPLPGLTPNYSDLVLIAQSANMSYETLIKEILSGAIKRWRLAKRDTQKDKKSPLEETLPHGIV